MADSAIIDKPPVCPPRYTIEAVRHMLTSIHDMNDRYTLGRQEVGNHGAMAQLREPFGTEYGRGPDACQHQQFGNSPLERRGGHMIGIGA